VQPCMKRRIRLGHRQQQPHGERQCGRGRVQTQPPTTIYDISVSQIVCNIAKRVPVARICRLFFPPFRFPRAPRPEPRRNRPIDS
jgi:hypothetical protein